MSQLTGEEKVQIFILIAMTFTFLRLLMKLPMKWRIIVIVIMLIVWAVNQYMITYQYDLVAQFREFFNMGELKR